MNLGLSRGVVVAGLVALVVPLVASAAPPANDDRANAEAVATFPATLNGTTVDATVERLDPQVSECGRAEGTVWYRIDRAPDGLIVLTVQAQGLAPVVRLYRQLRSSIREVDCASARPDAAASVSVESVRGATYLVLVGQRPNTQPAPFGLRAELFLPPANDRRGGAQRIVAPGTVKGSTLGATGDEADPESCGIAGATVWYALAPKRDGRIVLRLRAEADLDEAVAVLEQVRSHVDEVTCDATGRSGVATVTFDVRRGRRYLVVVGRSKGSRPGGFEIDTLAAQAAEKAPGLRLPPAGVRTSVHGLTDVNDLWWVVLQRGTTYRIAFSSSRCAELELRAPRRAGLRAAVVRYLKCGGYTTFTPGPEGGGRYQLEVEATTSPRTQPYRLQVAPVGVDDVGVGLPLANLTSVRGSLAPGGVDVVDVYHFDVATPSDVRLRLAHTARRSFGLLLLRDTGGRIAAARDQIRSRLGRGRYVVAVRGDVGSRAGRYALSLLVRTVTTTRLSIGGRTTAEVTPGTSVGLTVTTTPSPDGGVVELQIDRFDPLTGWHFFRLLQSPALVGTVTWAPPAPGRWRVRASFRGTLSASPSRSRYVYVVVATPIALKR